MWYFRMIWFGADISEPNQLCHEIGDDNFEKRRLEWYADGTIKRVDEKQPDELCWEEFSSINDFEKSQEYVVQEISKDEFEDCWSRTSIYL